MKTTKSKPKPKRRPFDGAVRHFYVCHPDGPELGLIAPMFNTEAEAIEKRDLWNRDVPGHYIMAIDEAPSEYNCWPNTSSNGDRRETI